MERTQRENGNVKVLFALLSIVMLSCTIVCCIGTLFCLKYGFYSNNLDIYQTMLKSHTNLEQIADYYSVYLRAEDNNAEYLSSKLYYDSIFSPDNTNLRFIISDKLGNQMFSNDPNVEKEQEILTVASDPAQVIYKGERYEKQVIFDDYEDLRNADMSSYLESPAEFSEWFYTDVDIEKLKSMKFHIDVCDETTIHYEVFHSLSEARQFDFKAKYGKYCTATVTENVPEGQQILIEVEEPIFSTITGTLEDYYYYKSENPANHYSDNEEIEKKLSSGLEVTLVGYQQGTMEVLIRTYVLKNMNVNDAIRSDYNVLSRLNRGRELILISCFLFGLLTIASCIGLCMTAGYAHGTSGFVHSRLHGISYEAFILMPILVVLAGYYSVYMMMENRAQWRATVLLVCGMAMTLSVSCVLLLYTTAIRAKTGTFWDSFFTIRRLKNINDFSKTKRSLSLFIVLACTVWLTLNLVVLLECTSTPLAMLLLALINLPPLLLIFYVVYCFDFLKQRTQNMEKGDFAEMTPKVRLVLAFKDFSASLDHMTNGIQATVDQRTRAERMRTELITNVSHDLKTPLTSIVNYVDLLDREVNGNERVEQYLEVLRRQSARLKKLTEDLVDASKASTGALKVELVPMDICVLIPQVACEYEDKFAEHNLTLITKLPEKPLYILADGRHLFRVLANLFGNACKYSLPSSRVYLEVAKRGLIAEITMKNISEHALNISPSELTERFVRGDASRHTEGSGLGLSIAKDLTRSQGGTLTLEIDGDLFKAIVRFPAYTTVNPQMPVPVEVPESENTSNHEMSGKN